MIFNSSIVKSINTVSGSRRALKYLTSFMAYFDYFLLYNYHKKYYGFYGQLILNTSKNLDDQKGILLQSFFQDHAYGFQLNDL